MPHSHSNSRTIYRIGKRICICFIDFAKAFGRLQHGELLFFFFLMLGRIKLDLDGIDLLLIIKLYWDKTTAIRVDGEICEYKPIERAVHQDCVMSLHLCNIYSAVVERELLKKKNSRKRQMSFLGHTQENQYRDGGSGWKN